MKVQIKKLVEVEAKTLHLRAGVRYWEDATVDGISDDNGDLIPCRVDGEEEWFPVIDIDSGVINNWTKGKTADIHYKVCDDFACWVLDDQDEEILKYEGYVPSMLAIDDNGYGDYIIMKVDSDGKINNWKFNIEDLTEGNED